MEFGWRDALLVEPSVVVREYQAQWKRPAIDVAELARLRHVEKWTVEKIALHFKVGVATVWRKLAAIK